MDLVLFYSWQSQTNEERNHKYIQKCINTAISNINKIHKKQYHIELQIAVRNIPGTKSIPNEIDKRISECDIFIGDLSIVNRQTKLQELISKLQKTNYRPSRNENVLIEFTRAKDFVSGYRVLAVMNEEYGLPGQNGENIPFDIRFDNNPIIYSYDSKYGEKFNEFVQILQEEITNCANQTIQDRKNKFLPLISYSEWSKLKTNQTSFKTNEYLTNLINNIQTGTKDTRLLGLSGTGKTRIVCEAFKNTSEASNLFYYDCNQNDQSRMLDVLNQIFSNHKFTQIIVLDNCNISLFRKVLKQKYDNDSKARIISIDNTPEEIFDDKISNNDCEYYQIDIEQLNEVITKIIEKKFPDITDEEKSRIVDFSDGIPLMAVLLCENLRNPNEVFGHLSDKELLKKLLNSENENEIILESFSLFKYLNKETQAEKIVISNAITPLKNNDSNYKLQQYEATYRKYKGREIIEQKGDLFTLRPKPLAIYLASDWFNKCSPQRMLNVISEIQSFNDNSLIESLSDEIKYLGPNQKAKELINDILKGPFDNAKVITTNMGSRLFRSFIEVNPIDTIECLYRNLINNQNTFFNSIDGYIRRNLIWTLEKGCFKNETFEKSGKLLMEFALAENENYGNNATNQFTRLFSVQLPGTQANLQSRFKLLIFCINNSNSKELGFKAIKNSLQLDNVYFGGAEKFGTNILQHYQPNTTEIIDYWTDVLNILLEEIKNKRDFENMSYSIIAHSARNLYRYGFFKVIFPFINEIISLGKTTWDEMLDALCLIRDYDFDTCNYCKKEVNDLIDKLQGRDFISRFKLISDYKRNRKLLDIKAENSLDYFKQEYSKLADEFINEKIPFDKIKNIFEANSNYCIGFGSRLAELLLDDSVKTKQIIDIGIEYLNSTEKFSRLFVDFAKKIDDENLKYLRDQIIHNKKLSEYLFSIYGERNAKLSDIQDLYNIADEFPENAFFFKDYWFNIPPIYWDSDENMVDHFIKLAKYGSAGINAILYVVFEFRSIDISKYSNTLITISNILTQYSLFKKEIDKSFLISALEYILQKTNNPQLAIHVNQEFLKYISIPENIHTDVAYYKSLYDILLKKYFKNIWEDLLIGIKSEGDKILVYLKLKQLLGAEIDTDHIADKGLLFDTISIQDIENNLNNDSLLQIRIMEIAPVFQDKIHFSNTVLYMLKKYGNNKKMLTSLVSSMNSFAWTGSLVPYYETCRNCFVSISNESDYSSIANWINDLITKYSEAIDQEKKRDEEAKLLYE